MNWYKNPTPGHVVQFYSHEDEFIGNLTDYIASGIQGSQTCLVIATREHLAQLEAQLVGAGIDIEVAKENSLYQPWDAQEAVRTFVKDGVVDEKLFKRHIISKVEALLEEGKELRLYGEMVALLWRNGHEDAVLQLEELWNKLLHDRAPLYCAYPNLHFSADPGMKNLIHKSHQLLPELQAA